MIQIKGLFLCVFILAVAGCATNAGLNDFDISRVNPGMSQEKVHERLRMKPTFLSEPIEANGKQYRVSVFEKYTVVGAPSRTNTIVCGSYGCYVDSHVHTKLKNYKPYFFVFEEDAGLLTWGFELEISYARPELKPVMDQLLQSGSPPE